MKDDMRIQLKNIQEMLEYSKQNKDLIYKIINKKISDNIDKDVDSILICEIFLTESSFVIENVVYRDEWRTSLKLALTHFEQIEDYETCQDISKTIEQLARYKK